MAERYMLDTNTASDAIKRSNRTLRHRMRQVPLNDICISAITEGELLFGMLRREDRSDLGNLVRSFLRRVEVVPWDSTAAARYAELRYRLQRAGTVISAMDMLIAAHALAADAVLVTADRAFRHATPLATEDWTRA